VIIIIITINICYYYYYYQHYCYYYYYIAIIVIIIIIIIILLLLLLLLYCYYSYYYYYYLLSAMLNCLEVRSILLAEFISLNGADCWCRKLMRVRYTHVLTFTVSHLLLYWWFDDYLFCNFVVLANVRLAEFLQLKNKGIFILVSICQELNWFDFWDLVFDFLKLIFKEL